MYINNIPFNIFINNVISNISSKVINYIIITYRLKIRFIIFLSKLLINIKGNY